MRKFLFFTFLLVLGGWISSGISMADWVLSEDDAIEVEKVLPGDITGDGTVSFTVVFTNQSGEIIPGEMRVYVDLGDGVSAPLNATGTSDDGSIYYDFVTADEGLFAVDESVTLQVIFAAAAVADVNVLPFEPILKVNDASLENAIFRKKISKTPEFYSGEAKIQVVPRYTRARNTKDELLYRDEETGSLVPCPVDEAGNADCPIITNVKPIVVAYLQEVEGTEFNSVPDYDANGDGVDDQDGLRLTHDVYTAVSLDEGSTWKRKNISKTAVKSSFQLPNGVDYPGDSESADMAVAGDNILVAWVDKYCRSGNPWDMEDTDDIYQVMGSQNSVDYVDVKGDEDPRPDLGVRPYSCVWAARGVLQVDDNSNDFDEESDEYGTVVWYSAEQITTGRRDAIRVFPAAEDFDGNGPGGFAITWQEDPKGLKTGKGRGPGAGMSGAGVNHKTDIWYTFLEFNQFAEIDEDFEPNPDADRIFSADEVDDTFGEDDTRTTPHVANTFSPPVRITDNAVCKERVATEIWAHVHDPAVTTCDFYYEGGTNNEPISWDDLPEEWTCPKCGLPKSSFLEDPALVGTRNEGAPYCTQFAGNTRVDGNGDEVDPSDPNYDIAYYTNEGEPLDGNTGASRANLSLVNWQGQTLALIAYEETKGIGVGGDKEAAAMEQAAAFPLVEYQDGAIYNVAYLQNGAEAYGTLSASPYAVYKNDEGELVAAESGDGHLGGFTNKDCRSCHYDYVVPKNRFIPVGDRNVCISGKGGIWIDNVNAYFPYSGYPLATESPVSDLVSNNVDLSASTQLAGGCVKFVRGTTIYPRDFAQTDPDALYVLPEHLPGWHSRNIDCTQCHVAYNTKDTDQDTAPDRIDLCLGTPLLADLPDGATIDLEVGSETYGCATTQTVGDPDNNKDEEPRYRHGKNIFYHHFPFDTPDTIAHGDQINIPNMDWTAPGTDSHDENARRVRVVPNPRYGIDGADITLGLLYKQGKDGQGAPADAFIRFFRDGFEMANLDGYATNLSSSTPYVLKEEELEEGDVDYAAGDGTGDLISGHQTPNVEVFYWTDDNLNDTSGYWYVDEDGEKSWLVDDSDGEFPDILDNPFDNVFSTRLEIRGNFVAVGFAYSTNWAAAKKAKDHYDFYVRTSDDGGRTWTLPVNVSELKNHEESVSDCRLLLPPDTLYPPGATHATFAGEEYKSYPIQLRDYFKADSFFVALGTKENVPQPAPNETELEEEEIFLDLSYSKAQRDPNDGHFYYEGVEKENPKYVANSLPYIDNISGEPTAYETDYNGIANEPNPAYDQYITEFDWIAKGDAFQGDVQVVTDPSGSTLHTIWEQELALDEESSMSHFQGSDVWYRKIAYQPPVMGDVDNNGIIDMNDIYALMSYRSQLADQCPECDIDGDKVITVLDARKLLLMCTYPKCVSQ